eukprot:CFRG5465T1
MASLVKLGRSSVYSEWAMACRVARHTNITHLPVSYSHTLCLSEWTYPTSRILQCAHYTTDSAPQHLQLHEKKRKVPQCNVDNNTDLVNNSVVVTQRLLQACVGMNLDPHVADNALKSLHAHLRKRINGMSLADTWKLVDSLSLTSKDLMKDRVVMKSLEKIQDTIRSHVQTLATVDAVDSRDTLHQKDRACTTLHPAPIAELAASEIAILCQLYESLDMIFHVDLHDECDKRVCATINSFSSRELTLIMKSFASLNCGTYHFWLSTRNRFETLCHYKHTSVFDMITAVKSMTAASIQCDGLLRFVCDRVGQLDLEESNTSLWIISQVAGAAGLIQPPDLSDVLSNLLTPKVITFLLSVAEDPSPDQQHHLVHVLWAMLVARMHDLHPNVVQQLATSVRDYRSQDSAETRFLNYQSNILLSCLWPDKTELHMEVTSGGSTRAPPRKKHVSGFENNINDIMVRMGLTTGVRQYETLGFFLDFAFPDLKVCIEADGPHHYLVDPETLCYRMNGITAVKAMCLKRSGWTMIHIPFWEWDLFREAEDRRIYLNSLLQPYLSDCPGIISVEQELAFNLPYLLRPRDGRQENTKYSSLY